MLALISVTISFLNNKNRRGPNIEPWGIPAFIVVHSEFDPFKTTRWDRPERYLSNHTIRLPDIPYCFSLNNNPLCHTRSKALLMSQNTTLISSPLSKALPKSFEIFTN